MEVVHTVTCHFKFSTFLSFHGQNLVEGFIVEGTGLISTTWKFYRQQKVVQSDTRCGATKEAGTKML